MSNSFFRPSVFLIFALLSMPLFVAAQDEKALRKEWKKKMKDTDPLTFKSIVDERDTLLLQKQKLSDMADGLIKDTAAKSATIASLNQETEKQKVDYQALAKQLEALTMAQATAAEPTEKGGKKVKGAKNSSMAKAAVTITDADKGTLYKVQIGHFRNRDLVKYFNNTPNFSGEVEADGSKKYTLGIFRDYWEADNFKKYLREMGVADAWVVSYVNGKRVNIKEALEKAPTAATTSENKPA